MAANSIPQSNPPHNACPEWLHIVERCSSTNTWAIEHAAELQHGDGVFTRQQTAGRGQQGRTWYAPPGVLTASFVLDALPIVRLPGLSLAAGLAVIHAIEEVLPQLELRLKWPNDVLIERRKLAGILCEAVSRPSSKQTRVMVGVGLNRAVDFVQAGLDRAAIGNAVSLHEVAQPPDELTLLERLRHHLLRVSDKFASNTPVNGGADLTDLPELRKRDALLGQFITLQRTGDSISGQAAGIDAEGRLLVQLPDRVVPVTSGHVLW